MQRRCEEDGAGNVYDAAFSRSRKCWREAQRLVEPLTLTRFHDFHGSSDPPNAILLLFRRSSGFLYFCRAAALTGVRPCKPDLIVQIKNLNSGRQAEGRLRLKATNGVSESLRLKFGSAGTQFPQRASVPARLPVIRAPPGPFELQEVTSEAVVEAELFCECLALMLPLAVAVRALAETAFGMQALRAFGRQALAWAGLYGQPQHGRMRSEAQAWKFAPSRTGPCLCRFVYHASSSQLPGLYMQTCAFGVGPAVGVDKFLSGGNSEECSLTEIRQRLTSLRYFPKLQSNGVKRVWLLLSSPGVTDAVESEVLEVWVHAVNTAPVLQPCRPELAAAAAAAKEGLTAGSTWFTVDEDTWEESICVDLQDDAEETPDSTLDLRVWVSKGMVHCDSVANASAEGGNGRGRQPGVFPTQCNGVSSHPGGAAVREACELSSRPSFRPSLAEVQACLRSLVFTPPSNFNGEVELRITVSDDGFSGDASLEPSAVDSEGRTVFRRGARGKPLTSVALAKIQVMATNDMPWLTWSSLPPKEIRNNESFPLSGLRLSDADVVGWKAEKDDSFTVTVEALAGEVLLPQGEPLLEQQVPIPPLKGRYVRLRGNLSGVQAALGRILYRPPAWFVGEDTVLVRASDGGLAGAGGNLTSEIGFQVRVQQALVVPGLVVTKALIISNEDEPLWLAEAAGIAISFPAEDPLLLLRISSQDGAVLPPLPGQGGNRVSSRGEVAADAGSGPGVDSALRPAREGLSSGFDACNSPSDDGLGLPTSLTLAFKVRFLHPERHWFSEHRCLDWSETVWSRRCSIRIEVCQWDIDAEEAVQSTCTSKSVEVKVQSADDAPMAYSVQYPWSLPLQVIEDTPLQLCCFKMYDPDFESAGATAYPSGAPWPLAVRVVVRAGNVSIRVPADVRVLSSNSSLVHLEGNLTDLEQALDSLTYSPAKDMNRQSRGLDQLCVLVADVPGARGIGGLRRFSGCWDVDIAPVNDPPVFLVESDVLGPEGPTCAPVKSTDPGTRFRMENPGSAFVPLPAVRLHDVDAEDLELDGPAVRVRVRAELGKVKRPDSCLGVQVDQTGILVEGFWWELAGGLRAVDDCLAHGLLYQAPSETFEGGDAVLFEASDLGHSGAPGPDGTGANGTARLRLLLEVVPIDEQLRLEVPSVALDEILEDSKVHLKSLALRHTPATAARRALVSLEASRGELSLSTDLGWLRERGVEMRRPMQGGSTLEWLGPASAVDLMLQNHVSYTCNVSGFFTVRVSLRVEQSPRNFQFDYMASRSLMIPVIGVNDAPEISGPNIWALKAGTTASLASVGIQMSDEDATEAISKEWTSLYTGSAQTAGPNEKVGSEMLAMRVLVHTSLGFLTIADDWFGIMAYKQGDEDTCGLNAAAAGRGCKTLDLRVRPEFLSGLADRILLTVPRTDGSLRGEMEVLIDDRGLVGRGTKSLTASLKVGLKVGYSDLPPSFEVFGLMDGPNASMFLSAFNQTRPGVEDPVMLAGGLSLQLHSSDEHNQRVYVCNISVPYGGLIELPRYNKDFLPSESILKVEHHLSGAGPLQHLALRAPLRDINTALQIITFHPRPGFTGAAYVNVVAGLADSSLLNYTQIPIYVESPAGCNASLRMDEEITVIGSDLKNIGERIEFYANAYAIEEDRGRKSFDENLAVKSLRVLQRLPAADCGPLTLELSLGQEEEHASGANATPGGHGMLVITGDAANDNCVVPDTYRTSGRSIILHGMLSQINSTLQSLHYRWVSDDGEEQLPDSAVYRSTLLVRAFTSADDPRVMMSGSIGLVVKPSDTAVGKEAPSVEVWLRMNGSDYDLEWGNPLMVTEDSAVELPCVRVGFHLPDRAEQYLRRWRYSQELVPDNEHFASEFDERDFNNITLTLSVKNGKLAQDFDGLAKLNNTGMIVLDGCLTNCSSVRMELKPLAFSQLGIGVDIDMLETQKYDGNFSICGLMYYPDTDFNTAPGGSGREEMLTVEATITGRPQTFAFAEAAISVLPVDDGLYINFIGIAASGGIAKVSQGSDVPVAGLLAVSAPDGDQDPRPKILNAPPYYPLNLTLAPGLSFDMPLPVHCQTQEQLRTLDEIHRRSQREDHAVFSDSLLPLSVLNLLAPLESLQRCLESLVVHVPWDAAVTAPPVDTSPGLMQVLPYNGTTGIDTAAFEVVLYFTDSVQAGEGFFELWDCGPDQECGQVSTFDDTLVLISPRDPRLVLISPEEPNVVRLKYDKILKPMRRYQFAVPKGALRNLRGEDYRGLPREDYNFMTDMGSAAPTGWRLVAEKVNAIYNGSALAAANLTLANDVAAGLAGTDAALGGWHVCELEFYSTADCTGPLTSGTPMSSTTTADMSFMDSPPNFSAALAFDRNPGTCWWMNSSLPGSWLGLQILEAGKYISSLRILGKDGRMPPEGLHLQFFYSGLWYNLQNYPYTEDCVQVEQNFKSSYGISIDTIEPKILDLNPPDRSSGISRTNRLTLYFSEDVKITDGEQVAIVDAGADGICGTNDDTVTYIEVSQSAELRKNGTSQFVQAAGSKLMIWQFASMTAGRWHCLQFGVDVIKDMTQPDTVSLALQFGFILCTFGSCDLRDMYHALLMCSILRECLLKPISGKWWAELDLAGNSFAGLFGEAYKFKVAADLTFDKFPPLPTTQTTTMRAITSTRLITTFPPPGSTLEIDVKRALETPQKQVAVTLANMYMLTITDQVPGAQEVWALGSMLNVGTCSRSMVAARSFHGVCVGFSSAALIPGLMIYLHPALPTENCQVYIRSYGAENISIVTPFKPSPQASALDFRIANMLMNMLIHILEIMPTVITIKGSEACAVSSTDYDEQTEKLQTMDTVERAADGQRLKAVVERSFNVPGAEAITSSTSLERWELSM
ncbi:unnamed protein product [Polarella glacialis]|uniref:Uncharacterized protein n=1 Tax=Polarella glacialis TaxID=89957 RepID=A0A813JGZ8_POLGL|nr:unnamed protein product [Polarella glacialis]